MDLVFGSIKWMHWFRLLIDLLVEALHDLLFDLLVFDGMHVNEEWLETLECKDAFAEY